MPRHAQVPRSPLSMRSRYVVVVVVVVVLHRFFRTTHTIRQFNPTKSQSTFFLGGLLPSGVGEEINE